jgi:L-threonylcarbamoyladenylate synthase
MQILKVSSENFKNSMKEAVKIIKQGGVLVCPTDTIYGLIADAKNRNAVKKVFNIKKRFSKKPLPVFVKDLKMAKNLADINKKQERILRKIWFTRLNFKKGSKILAGQGKLTAILKTKFKNFPKGILSKDGKIGLRIPKYKLLNLLLEKANCPLTATSANISGRPGSIKIKEILKQFKNNKYQPDLVLDAGTLKDSLPSTVFDISEISASTLSRGRRVDFTNFKVLRWGQLPKDKILKILKKLRI